MDGSKMNIHQDNNLNKSLAHDIFLQGSEIASHALSSVAVRLNEGGAGVLIGDANHVLTAISHPDMAQAPDGEIWLNWFNQSYFSESSNNSPVRLQLARYLMFHYDSSGNSYSVIIIDNFDYVNSNAKVLFGGLKISESNPVEGEAIYIPQYGTEGLTPMYISDMNNGELIKVLSIKDDRREITYDSGIAEDSPGSPVISRESHQLVGLQRISEQPGNIAISANVLRTITNPINNAINNISVIGLGKVFSFDFELTSSSMLDISVPIDLGQEGRVVPFDTLKIKNYDDHSIIQVDAIDLITQKVFPLTFKASLVIDDYQTHLHDSDISGEVILRMYDFDYGDRESFKCWVTFKISDDVNNLRNYVIRLVIAPDELPI